MHQERNVDLGLRSYKALADKTAEKVKYPEGWVTIFDIIPPVETANPIFLAQGWGVNMPRYRRMERITKSGRRAIVPHIMPYGLRPSNFSKEAEHENERKASIYSNALVNRKLKKVDAIAISGGTLPTLTAANNQPELFENIILITPAVLIGGIGKFELSRRFLSKDSRKRDLHLRDKKVDISPLQAGVELLVHIGANPNRALAEVTNLSYTNTLALCGEVAQRGVNIYALVAKDDTIFPLNEFYRNLENYESEAPKRHMPFAGIVEIEGKHDEPNILGPSRVDIALGILDSRNGPLK